MKASKVIPWTLLAIIVVLVMGAAIKYFVDKLLKRNVSTYRTSPTGIKLIQEFESFSPTAYLDNKHGKVWTIGWGHTSDEHQQVYPGLTITRQRGDELLKIDLLEAEAIVKRRVLVPITQNQFDALVSFAYNTGFPSATVTRMVNENTPEEQFKAWYTTHYITDNGVIQNGLIRRRKAEAELYWR